MVCPRISDGIEVKDACTGVDIDIAGTVCALRKDAKALSFQPHQQYCKKLGSNLPGWYNTAHSQAY